MVWQIFQLLKSYGTNKIIVIQSGASLELCIWEGNAVNNNVTFLRMVPLKAPNKFDNGAVDGFLNLQKALSLENLTVHKDRGKFCLLRFKAVDTIGNYSK